MSPFYKIKIVKCSKFTLLLVFQLTLVKNMLAYTQNFGLQMVLISPADIKMKQSKNVIGLNEEEVFTFADAKKKQGNSELRKDVEFDDVAADFVLRVRSKY